MTLGKEGLHLFHFNQALLSMAWLHVELIINIRISLTKWDHKLEKRMNGRVGWICLREWYVSMSMYIYICSNVRARIENIQLKVNTNLVFQHVLHCMGQPFHKYVITSNHCNIQFISYLIIIMVFEITISTDFHKV